MGLIVSSLLCLLRSHCPLICQDTKVNPQLVRPNPPSFGPGFVSEYWKNYSEMIRYQNRQTDDGKDMIENCVLCRAVGLGIGL